MNDRTDDDVRRLLPLLDFVEEIRRGRRCVYCGRHLGGNVHHAVVGQIEGHRVSACQPSCYAPGRGLGGQREDEPDR